MPITCYLEIREKN